MCVRIKREERCCKRGILLPEGWHSAAAEAWAGLASSLGGIEPGRRAPVLLAVGSRSLLVTVDLSRVPEAPSFSGGSRRSPRNDREPGSQIELNHLGLPGQPAHSARATSKPTRRVANWATGFLILFFIFLLLFLFLCFDLL